MLSLVSIDWATSADGWPVASYDINPANSRSRIRPPRLSLVPVGISGLGGSPPLTTTNSGLRMPPPQPASIATASTPMATGVSRADAACTQRMTATLGPAARPTATGPIRRAAKNTCLDSRCERNLPGRRRYRLSGGIPGRCHRYPVGGIDLADSRAQAALAPSSATGPICTALSPALSTAARLPTQCRLSRAAPAARGLPRLSSWPPNAAHPVLGHGADRHRRGAAASRRSRNPRTCGRCQLEEAVVGEQCRLLDAGDPVSAGEPLEQAAVVASRRLHQRIQLSHRICQLGSLRLHRSGSELRAGVARWSRRRLSRRQIARLRL